MRLHLARIPCHGLFVGQILKQSRMINNQVLKHFDKQKIITLSRKWKIAEEPMT